MSGRAPLAIAILLIIVGAALVAYGVVAGESEGKAYIVILIGPFPIALGYNASPEELAAITLATMLAVAAMLLLLKHLSKPPEHPGEGEAW